MTSSSMVSWTLVAAGPEGMEGQEAVVAEAESVVVIRDNVDEDIQGETASILLPRVEKDKKEEC